MTSNVPLSTAPRLVGRDEQLAELVAALDHAEKGCGRLLLIVGEPGIGKSALAEGFARQAADRGAALAWGRAWEAGGAPPYWPWIEVLRSLPLDDNGSDVVRSSLAIVSEMIPDVNLRVERLDPPPPLEPAQARFRLFEAVTTLLRWSSRNHPLLVVLDDLHVADPASLSLLLFAARGVRRARVVLVGTFRDNEARQKPLVSETLTQIAREGRYLPLGRLDREAVAIWLGEHGVAAAPDWADQLYRRSEGNPLFLVEMVRLLRGMPGRESAALQSLPDGIREVIGARIRELPADCRLVLELAATIGRTFEAHRVATACGITVGEVRDRLVEPLRAEVVAPVDDERYTFTHILIREALYEPLPASRRAELHESIARTLIDGGEATAWAEIVHHLFEAAPRIGTADAIAWARRAASASLEQLAFDEAVGFLERALQALPADADLRERCDVLLELAGARIGAGQGERGRETALSAAAVARRLGDGPRLARAALRYGEVFTYATVNPTLVQLLEEALGDLAEDEDELRARLLGRLAAAKQPAADPREPMAVARRAIEMARGLADPRVRLAVLQSATSALLYFAEPEERIALDHELLDLASRHGDRLRMLRANLRLVFDYLESGDAAQADSCIETYDTLAGDIGHPTYLWYTPLLRATRAAMRGSFTEAEALVERSRALADRSEEPNRALTFAMHRIGLLMTWARDEALREETPALLQIIAERSDPWLSGSLRAMFAARFGPADSVPAALSAYDSDLTEGRGRMAVAWIAQAAVNLSDHRLATRAYRAMVPLASRNHNLGIVGCFCLGPITHPLATTAAFLGYWEEAWRHFEHALERADALGSPPLRAQIELDHALALLRRDEAGHRDRACRLLEAAQSTADHLGLPAILDACVERLDELGSRSRGSLDVIRPAPAAVGVPQVVHFDLRREGDGWAIAWGCDCFHLDDSRGLQILARLVTQPDQALHVTELLAPPGEAGHIEDAGEMLDAEAVASYRRRAQELETELDEAQRWNDTGRAEWLCRELEFLRAELARAVGLGGRRRRAASTSERARINVRRRIVHALEKIEQQCPPLAQHLRWAVKTGHHCVYHPSGRPR